jgi:RNA polymerase sigma factor (sigma-70 family)
MNQDLTGLRQRLRRYLGRFVRRPEDIEDIVQESFARVLMAGARGNIEFSDGYIFRTARNLAFKAKARHSYLLESSLDEFLGGDPPSPSPGIEDRAIIQERFELLCEAVALLPSQCRKVLILRHVYGLSQQATAERLGISVSTVEKHLSKAIVRCGSYIDASSYDGTPPSAVSPARAQGKG